MTKKFGKSMIKNQESANDVFKREISNTRQLVKDIISERRESAKIKNIQHSILFQK